jgi:hypothetical protein
MRGIQIERRDTAGTLTPTARATSLKCRARTPVTLPPRPYQGIKLAGPETGGQTTICLLSP